MPTNRLIDEKSPYLLQHAHNPVDWRPWGPEAFEEARTLDKPVFLSVGYSTCHWCHVMERESFENEEIAQVLNRAFVPIKVDREERPDVDRIYMIFVQATTGGGGWPMSVWLTPELKPFFGGTYFPPDNRYGRPGFKAVLEYLERLWSTERPKILESAASVTSQLEQQTQTQRGGGLDEKVAESAFNQFRRMFDSKLGGFGGAPKFPRPSVHNFLLRYARRSGNDEPVEMVVKTLEEMARGGMHDQLGGGFHRYSVDDRWLVPHFEKMLYDQAQLAISYLEAYQVTGDEFHAGMARDIFEYVLRDMTHPEGGFYSAEDADSVIDPAKPDEKGEGAFYVWDKAEIDALLSERSREWFCYRYGVEPGGNVRDDPHAEFTGKNILYQARTVEETARRFSVPIDVAMTALESARSTLLTARSQRIRPHLDDKVLTAWNALMISAFARGAQVLDEPRFAEAAGRATNFILARMFDPSTLTLLRRFRDGDSGIPGFLDDYAFLAEALVDLFEAAHNPYHLELACQLAGRMRDLFEDVEHRGFFSTAAGDANLILRVKEDYDGAEPSGNSIAILVLLRLSRLLHRDEFRQSAESALAALSRRISATPAGAPQLLASWLYGSAEPRQIVFSGEGGNIKTLLKEASEHFLPETEIIVVNEDNRDDLARLLPEVEGMAPTAGTAAAYVCEDFACQAPVSDPQALAALIK